MTSDQPPKPPPGPDLTAGVSFESLTENLPLLGHVDGDPVILVRAGQEVFAVGATCTHYGGPLAEGLVVDGTVRCPWHHACFNLRTGQAKGAPALSPVACYAVDRKEGRVKVSARKRALPAPTPPPRSPSSVVIVGAGAAGAACTARLREKGYAGPITLVGDEEPGPVDRPNLSKDYLAGNAPEDWIPLKSREDYEAMGVELVLGDAAGSDRHREAESDPPQRPRARVRRAPPGDRRAPRTLPIEGAGLPHVFRLRTLAESRAIITRASHARHAAVIGSSFIGLEVAAALRHRGLDVTVIGTDKIPLERVLGPQIGQFVRELHEAHGVQFRLGDSPTLTGRIASSSRAATVPAELVVLGVGVAPRTDLAQKAGLKVDNGIVVDENLRASAPDVYAAGDVARFPERVYGEAARIEHWVLAERHGQAVAREILGLGGPSATFPSSGASTTTSRSPTSATPRAGTPSSCAETSPLATPRSSTARPAACSPSRRSAATP